jgi:hypothetical protein
MHNCIASIGLNVNSAAVIGAMLISPLMDLLLVPVLDLVFSILLGKITKKSSCCYFCWISSFSIYFTSVL